MFDDKTPGAQPATGTVARATTDGPFAVDPRGRDWPGNFTMVPEALTADWRVQDRAQRLWQVLDRQAAGRPYAADSYAAIGRKLRDKHGDPASIDTVHRLLANLAATGWITVVRAAGAGLVGKYLLNHSVPDHPDGQHSRPVVRKTAESADLPREVRKTAEKKSAKLRTHIRASPLLREEEKGEGDPPPPPTLQPSNPEPRTEERPPPPPAPPPTYVGRCPAHGHDPSPPNCHGCRDARIAHEAARPPAHAVVKCRAHYVEHRPGAECPMCRADRIARPDDAPARPPTRVGDLGLPPAGMRAIFDGIRTGFRTVETL